MDLTKPQRKRMTKGSREKDVGSWVQVQLGEGEGSGTKQLNVDID